MSDLAARNQERMNQLAAQGLSLEPTLMLKMRVDLLTSVLVEAKLVDEEDLNDKWETYIESALDQAEEEVRRARLLIALDGPESNIVDL